MFQGVAPSPPPPPPRLQGERIMSGVALEEACRIGSTPPSKVMIVLGVEGEPSVATIINASPFTKSALVAAGMRAIICCRSPRPCPPAPGPPAPGPAPAPGALPPGPAPAAFPAAALPPAG